MNNWNYSGKQRILDIDDIGDFLRSGGICEQDVDFDGNTFETITLKYEPDDKDNLYSISDSTDKISFKSLEVAVVAMFKKCVLFKEKRK